MTIIVVAFTTAISLYSSTRSTARGNSRRGSFGRRGVGGWTPDDVVGGGVGGDGASAAAVAEIVLAGRGGGKRGGLGLLTTNSPISPFVGSLVEDLGAVRVRSGGAGNKMMMLLERSIYGGCDDGDGGGPMLYIQDRGVSRLDTCAAEGVLEAHGGRLTILQVPRRPDQSRFRTRPCMPDEEQSTPTERRLRRRWRTDGRRISRRAVGGGDGRENNGRDGGACDLGAENTHERKRMGKQEKQS